MEIPKLIFVVPYRNRPEQLHFFKQYMSYIMEDVADNSYEIVISQQPDDKRSFNRGEVKNIGFIEMKNKYPDHYKDITFIFNDVDTVPYKKNLLNYETQKGIIKHFFGFISTLGGIVSIKGEDFEKINGFPNLWGWGCEDNILQIRAEKNNIKIDRSTFYHSGDMSIMQFQNDFFNNIMKNTSKNIMKEFTNNNGGINTIKELKTQHDGIYVNIINFKTEAEYNEKEMISMEASRINKLPKNDFQERAILYNNRFKMFKKKN